MEAHTSGIFWPHLYEAGGSGDPSAMFIYQHKVYGWMARFQTVNPGLVRLVTALSVCVRRP